jgi:phenylalanyl-tRNA synthetase alpha chain
MPTTLTQLNHQIALVRQTLAQLDNALGLEAQRARYFGKKQGMFTQLAKVLPQIETGERAAAGQAIQALKGEIESALAKLGEQATAAAWNDPTLPAYPGPVGHLHPLTQAMFDITRIFERIGFTRNRYPEVDWEYYPFVALNMPKHHPARDEWETFFVDTPEHAEKGKILLTPHTSNGQVREMERLLGQPPIRMINIARCYRRQQDVTHTQMFHQFEGLVVDKGITIQHLKGTIDHFAREWFGTGAKSRIRPFHFQFTEPSFEVDFSCTVCGGTGILLDGEKREKCRFCKSGWHEVGGAGMVHPNVLKAGGIDPSVYTGFAFGWGIERTYALQKGLHLDDIRALYGNDPRFLEQF